MHTMKDGIRTRRQKRRTLRNICKQEEKLLPKRIHSKQLVRRITVQKEGLTEKRQVPVGKEKDKYYGHFDNLL